MWSTAALPEPAVAKPSRYRKDPSQPHEADHPRPVRRPRRLEPRPHRPRGPGIGLEWDSWACKTRARVVRLTIQTDVARSTVWIFSGRIPGLTASPPCQAWWMAGKRLGLVDQPLVRQAAALVTAAATISRMITRGVRDGSAGARRRGSSTRPGSAGGSTGTGGTTRGRSGVARASVLFGSGLGSGPSEPRSSSGVGRPAGSLERQAATSDRNSPAAWRDPRARAPTGTSAPGACRCRTRCLRPPRRVRPRVRTHRRHLRLRRLAPVRARGLRECRRPPRWRSAGWTPRPARCRNRGRVGRRRP